MKQGTWKISTSVREENEAPMANSKKLKAVPPKSSTSGRSRTTIPSFKTSSDEPLQSAPIQISPEELLQELQNDPVVKPHLEKALATVALRKQTEMFQQVQKELAEARAELSKR
jgi:hypothetical protein